MDGLLGVIYKLTPLKWPTDDSADKPTDDSAGNPTDDSTLALLLLLTAPV